MFGSMFVLQGVGLIASLLYYKQNEIVTERYKNFAENADKM